jgi:hypothetical protein
MLDGLRVPPTPGTIGANRATGIRFGRRTDVTSAGARVRSRTSRLRRPGRPDSMRTPRANSSADDTGVRTKSDWLRWSILVAQVALLAFAVERFQIGSRAFSTITFLALGAYVLQAFVPARLRQAFFALLSMAGVVLVLGPETGLWLVAIGLGLIALAHLRLSFTALSALMLAVCGVLMAGRAGLYRVPWSGALWPILGGMFMFRMVVFLYDRKHGERATSLWETVSYFFLLPNVCFPLFPVVDYKTFRRSTDLEPELVCHQVGVRWMVRGLLHLLLYRFVYYYGVVSPGEVSSVGELAQYLVSNLALYLRVSGTFHLAVGMLRLFGYALPETNFLYFASASINDFWRRANIYWKDFMLKVFYLPTYFKLRKKNETRAFVQATLVVVAATWILHSYQSFWIRSSFPLKWQDAAFWTALGTFMVVNTALEKRKSGARGRRARKWSVHNAFGQAWRIALTFTFLCVIWSLWACESFGAWLDMLRLRGSGVADASIGTAWIVLPALLAVSLLEGLAGVWMAKRGRKGALPLPSALLSAASLGLLILVGTPAVYTAAGPAFSTAAQSLRVTKLNRLDAASLERGYYEDLLDVNRFNAELWRAYKAKPASWLQLHETTAMRSTSDALLTELVPGLDTPYKGASLQVNQWGFRDREYALDKPPGTTRLALMGASYVMGSGVENDQTFDAVLEDLLNEHGPGAPDRAYEVHNWGTGGYSPVQRLLAFEGKALRFAPDQLVYVAHENEEYRTVRYFLAARSQRATLPAGLEQLLADAGIDRTGSALQYEQALEPVVRDALAWSWNELTAVARANGVTPVWIFLPTLEMHASATDLEWMRDLARRAGFTVIDLHDLWDGADTFSLRLADWDYHPNAEGHRRIAERLWRELQARPEILR